MNTQDHYIPERQIEHPRGEKNLGIVSSNNSNSCGVERDRANG